MSSGGQPKELTGFDYLLDKVNRIVLDRVITQDLGPVKSLLFPKKARETIINDLLDEWSIRGFTPSTILNAAGNKLQGRGPFGMRKEQPSPEDVPQFDPPSRDYNLPEFDPRGRDNLRHLGGVVKSRV